MPQHPQPSLRLADGGNFITRWAQNVMRPGNTDKRLREIEAPPPAPVVRPAPPPPPPPNPNPNATPDNPAGIRFQDGGGLSKDAVMEAIARQRAAAGGQSGGGSGTVPQTQPQPQQPGMMRDFLRNPGSVLRDRERAAGLRFQDGGIVPGSGRGDKIPAKYEPGEFVVSNDMIDDNPGLREHLAGLRAETLAARGKTVEEADAKALRYRGGRPSLRADGGFGPDGKWIGDNRPVQPTGGGSTPPKSPTFEVPGGIPRSGPSVSSTPLSAADAAAYDASPEGRATKAQALKEGRGYFQGKPNAPAAPTAPTPAANGPTTLRKVASGVGNALMYGGAGVGGALAAKGLRDVGAPKGTVAVPGERQAGDSANSMQIPSGPQGVTTPGAQPYNFWTDNEIGRNLGNAANAIAPLGGLAAAARVPGTVSKAFGLADAAVTGLATGVHDERARAKLMPADTPRKTATAPTPDLRNPYANVTPEQGRAMAEINARAPGRGSQPAPFDFDTFEPGPGEGAFRNEQTGKVTRLTSTPQGGAAWRAVPSQQAMPSPAPRARQEVRVPVLNPNGGVFAAMTDFTNQAGRAVQAIAANKGLRNDRKDALDAESTFAKIDQGDRELQLRGREADMLEKDLGLRREAQMATARSRQQELAYNRERDALKDAMDLERHTQTVGHNATNNARERLKGMAVRDDGKGGTVVDEGRLARLESTLAKMSPGWALSGEATQAKLLRKAEASVNILEGLNSQRNNGWFQALGIDGKSAQLDNLPHKEMKGARLNEVGFVEGAKTPGTSRKDYVIETSGGHKLYLPRSSVNQGELELLKSLGVDITGIEK